MIVIKNLIKGEFFKVFKTKGFKLIVILSLIASVLFSLYYLVSIMNKPGDFNNISGFSIFYTLLFGLGYQDFLPAIVASIFVCKDFENKTINMSLTYGYDRIKVLLSKFFVYLIISIASIYIFIISAVMIFSLLYGFGEGINIYTILIILKSALVHILGIVSISSIIFLIAILTKNSLLTILFPLIIFIVYMLTNNSGIFIIENLLTFNFVRDALINKVEFIDGLKVFISTSITLIFSFIISYSYFKKREFK